MDDEVYRKRQLEEGGPDPFQDVHTPESDPARSAMGDGRGDAAAVELARRMLERKHREFHQRVRPQGPHDDLA